MATIIQDKSKDAELIEDEKIDQILKDVTLKYPKKPLIQFVKNEYQIYKSKNDDKKITFSEMSTLCSEKWRKLSDSEKQYYEDLYQQEKKKYQADVEFVRHYLFKDFNENIRRPPTAYKLYLSEKLREGLVQGKSPKKIKKESSSEWAKMPKEEKHVYLEKKKENDNWFSKINNINKVTPISLFIQRRIEEAKYKMKQILSVKDVASEWKQLSKEEKRTYDKYAQEENEEREKLRDLYELVNGVKPKRPGGAYKIFVEEKIKNGEIKTLSEASNLWSNLSEDEKEEYHRRSHRCVLAYRYKQMIFNKKIKKILPKKPHGAFQQFLKDKRGQKDPSGENWLKSRRDEFDKLPEDKKRKYEEKAEKARKLYEKKMLEFKDKVFDIPKRPISAFLLYLCERIPILKKENPEEVIPVLVSQIAKEWKEGRNIDKNYYFEKFRKDQERFKIQQKEFNKKGYYTKVDNDQKEENSEPERKRIRNKKRTVNYNDNSHGRRKKRTNSKSTQKRKTNSSS